MQVEEVILVDQDDQNIGVMEKMEAHQKGMLHRAFSVFVFNSRGEVLLQQRAHHKYHSGGLWTNTCCSHPRPNETTEQAAKRRLIEEMGLYCEVKNIFNFIYESKLDNALIEHELDHVFFAASDDIPTINPEEVADFKYETTEAIEKDIEENGENYTAWFKICFEEVKNNYLKGLNGVH